MRGTWQLVLLRHRVIVDLPAAALDRLTHVLSGVADMTPAVAEAAAWQLTDEAGCWQLRQGQQLRGEFEDLDSAVVALAGDLELDAASLIEPEVALHAGAVEIDGVAVLLPGRSFAGKSTLTAALLRAGARYLSDEYALLDADGLVHPYPRPLRVRRSEGAPSVVPAAELGAESAVGPVPVGLVALLHHDAPAGWQLDPLSPATLTLALLDNAVAAQTRSADVLAACSAVARSATGWRGTRGEADEAARLLIDLVRAGTP